MDLTGKIIAYCGLLCSDCPAYVATQANDPIALQRVVEQWREEFNAPDMTVESALCDGCLGEGHKCGYCASCEIRACGVARGVANCAHCTDYACDKLTTFFSMAPNAQSVLDQVRASLAG
jgi:hypothetical protein